MTNKELLDMAEYAMKKHENECTVGFLALAVKAAKASSHFSLPLSCRQPAVTAKARAAKGARVASPLGMTLPGSSPPGSARAAKAERVTRVAKAARAAKTRRASAP